MVQTTNLLLRSSTRVSASRLSWSACSTVRGMHKGTNLLSYRMCLHWRRIKNVRRVAPDQSEKFDLSAIHIQSQSFQPATHTWLIWRIHGKSSPSLSPTTVYYSCNYITLR